MKKIVVLLALAFTSLSATSLRADLLGSRVSGSLTFAGNTAINYFDAVNGYVPADFGNSSSPNNVVINSGIEFGYRDDVNRDTANFTANGLTVRDVCLVGANCTVNNPFQMIFTDVAFGSASLLTNDLGVTFSFSGDTLTINYPGRFVADNNAIASFQIGTAAQTPEPGTLGLVATGIMGAAAALRRRLLA